MIQLEPKNNKTNTAEHSETHTHTHLRFETTQNNDDEKFHFLLRYKKTDESSEDKHNLTEALEGYERQRRPARRTVGILRNRK